MRGKWLKRIRQLHTWLGVFFSPLLLLFIITGWWQTFATDDDKDKSAFHTFMERFSDIHTSDYFSHGAGQPHASVHFKLLVGGMAVVLIFTIVLGLALACQNVKRFWMTAGAFLLGILVPALVLYLN
jgi:hypothetical protein